MWIKRATKEEKLEWKLLDLKKELEIGFARMHVQFDQMSSKFNEIGNKVDRIKTS